MRIDSRERGQGITEYFLIIAVGLIIILGAMYLFRNTIAGNTREIADAVSGKNVQSAVPDAASSAAASDTSQAQADSESQGSGGGTESKKAESGEAGSSDEESEDSGEDGQARIAENDDGSSGGSARGEGAPRATPRGVTIVVLVVIAGVLVLVVGYFLTASSR